MKLEKMVVTADLDMGQELVVKVSNNGEQKYWRAFMQFCINGGDMQSLFLFPDRPEGKGLYRHTVVQYR